MKQNMELSNQPSNGFPSHKVQSTKCSKSQHPAPVTFLTKLPVGLSPSLSPFQPKKPSCYFSNKPMTIAPLGHGTYPSRCLEFSSSQVSTGLSLHVLQVCFNATSSARLILITQLTAPVTLFPPRQ